MAESWEITTDAGTEELVDIVQGFPGIASFGRTPKNLEYTVSGHPRVAMSRCRVI